MKSRSLILWLIALTACASDAPAPPSTGTGGAATGDSGRLDDAAGDDATLDRSFDDEANDSGPVDVPSKQTVNIVVRNDSTVDKLVVVLGERCTPFGIQRNGDQGLEQVPMLADYQCWCECPPPLQMGPTELRRLKPGETRLLSWDARSLTQVASSQVCSPGMPPANGYTFIAAPVSPGTYRVQIVTEDAPPYNCMSQDGTNYVCQHAVDPQRGAGGIASICSGTTVVSSNDFMLPSSGDVTVTVGIP